MVGEVVGVNQVGVAAINPTADGNKKKLAHEDEKMKSIQRAIDLIRASK